MVNHDQRVLFPQKGKVSLPNLRGRVIPFRWINA